MLTLLEAAKGTQDPLRLGIIELIAMNNPILERIPTQPVSGNAYTYTEEGALPSIGARAINQAFEESTGTLNTRVETMKILGGDMDIDRALVAMNPERSIGDLRAIHTSQKVKALSAYWMKQFIKGNETTDNRVFDGLERRCLGSQVIYQGTTAGGDALTLAKLDELLDLIDGADVLLMNKTLRRKVNSLIRAAGQTQEFIDDSFGRQVMAYAGVPIVVIEEDETGTEILRFNELGSTGSTFTSSSIYGCKFGADEYLALLENPAGMEVRDLGELDTKPVFRTRIEWITTLAMFRARAAARLGGISNA